MEAQFDTTLFIRNIFDSVADLIPSVRLEIRKDGLRVCCVEMNGCCIVSLYISEKDMKGYTYDEETDIMIKLQDVLKKLKEMDKSRPLKLVYKKEKDAIYFSQTKANGRTSRHESKLIMVDIENMEIPKVKYYAEVNMPVAELSSILKVLLISNETCKITTLTNKRLLVLSSNGEFGSGREEYPIEDNDSFINENDHDYFSIPYMIKFLKAGVISPEVKICLSKDNPLCLQYGLGSGYIHYYLSPKVEDENDVAQQGDIENDEVKVDVIKIDNSDTEVEELNVSDTDEEESEESEDKKPEYKDADHKEEIVSDSSEDSDSSDSDESDSE